MQSGVRVIQSVDKQRQLQSKSIVFVAGLQGVRRKTRNWFLFNAEFSHEPWFAE